MVFPTRSSTVKRNNLLLWTIEKKYIVKKKETRKPRKSLYDNNFYKCKRKHLKYNIIYWYNEVM